MKWLVPIFLLGMTIIVPVPEELPEETIIIDPETIEVVVSIRSLIRLEVEMRLDSKASALVRGDCAKLHHTYNVKKSRDGVIALDAIRKEFYIAPVKAGEGIIILIVDGPEESYHKTYSFKVVK